ncbi:restriction endonuclease subunit S [Planococcus sp. 107-1]|uniref:restriction endonuclease subunit S n=1 Tax=Planococcus sp. 107-1 TaxID=2908840 RepID=UPI001F22270C|nr:restriction endonuclease subunit S [Planococcus sp. 107-1]UJF27558.1 restriction endonuclease subunit S [Planococcus sp. 107-1]
MFDGDMGFKLKGHGCIYFFIQGAELLEVANKSIGSKMPRADWNSVSEFPFKIPTIKEQEKIVGYLKTLENKIVKEKEKLMFFEEQKRGFMQKMFV